MSFFFDTYLVKIKAQQGENPFGEDTYLIPTAETPINMDLHHQQQQQQQQQIRLDTSNKSTSNNDPDFYSTATSFVEELSSPIPQQPFDPNMTLSNSGTAASVDTNNSESSQMQHLFHNDLNHMAALSSPTNSRHQQTTLSMTSSPTQLIQMTVFIDHLLYMVYTLTIFFYVYRTIPFQILLIQQTSWIIRKI